VRRPASAARGARATAACLVAAALASCAYSTKRLADVPGASTIAVLQFENQTFRRDYEFRLTRAVAEEVRARTSLRIGSPSSADVLLTGTITSVETRALADDRNLDPLVDRLRVYVVARLVERATGRCLRTWQVADEEEFARGRFGETLEGSAIDDSVRVLAQKVVQGLEPPIGDPGRAPPPPARSGR
jgi:hypothetical protein